MAVIDSLVYTVLQWSAKWTVKNMSNFQE